MKTFNIMYGLPGSGKTHYCRKAMEEDEGTYAYIDMDYYWKGSHQPYNSDDWIRKAIMRFSNAKCEHFYIDGLFTTRDILLKVISAIGSFYECGIIMIHAWNEDRECCMINDAGRREESSEFSIRNMPFEYIASAREDIHPFVHDNLYSNFEYYVSHHNVVKMPDWKLAYAKKGLDVGEYYSHAYDGKNQFNNGEYLCSSYIETSESYISIEDIYYGCNDFMNQIYDLLESFVPDITMKMARSIIAECTEIRKGIDHDYYCGATYWIKICLNLKKMYQKMTELNMI